MGAGSPTASETATWLASVLPDGTRVRPVGSQRRRLAVLHVLEVTGADGARSKVVAKCAARSAVVPPVRPNLARQVPPGELLDLERAAAQRLHDLLGAVDDARAPGFVASRPEPATLVLEWLEPAADLSRLLRQCAVVPRPSSHRRVVQAYASAGRAAHRMSESGPLPDRQTSHADVADMLATARSMATFLEAPSAGLSLTALRRVEDLLDGWTDWPVAAGHGDFAPRNVLVTDDGIAVIDALFAHNVPRFEDPARFVVNTLAPLAEMSLPALDRRRIGHDATDSFLAECVPEPQRTPFDAMCIVVALDRWCALAARTGGTARRQLRRRSAARAIPGIVSQLLERTR